MAIGIWQILIIAVIVLILFGFGSRGKISALMGDFGKGLRNFKDQIKPNEEIDNNKIKNSSVKKATKPKRKKTKKTT